MPNEQQTVPPPFDFSLDESWEQNLRRFEQHLVLSDPECAQIFFDHLATLQSDESNARRDFNQKVFEAIETAVDDEISGRRS